MSAALSVARPAAAAVALVAAIGVTWLALYLFWPAGVAVGLALGALVVLAVGARMQLTERLQPADEDLAARLGIAPEPLFVAEPAPRPAEVVAPVRVPAVRPEPVAVAEVRPEVQRPEVQAPAVREQAVQEHDQHEHDQHEHDQHEHDQHEHDQHEHPGVLYFTSDDDPDAAEARVVVEDDRVRTDLDALKDRLGDDYRDFARAARLVVSTQYASAARLQRELELPYARARRLLGDLEQQHFVGPATGSLPRQVLMPKERLPEVEALLADA